MYVFCLLFPPRNENQAVKPCENLKDMTRETMNMMTMKKAPVERGTHRKAPKGAANFKQILPQLNEDQSR